MDLSFDSSEWVSQVRRGTLELCVLALIAQEPHYGYELIASLGRWEQLAVTDGTLYPLLRRLEKQDLISGKWQESMEGPPRKYYHLTEAGQRLLSSMWAEWRGLARAMQEIEERHTDESSDQDTAGVAGTG